MIHQQANSSAAPSLKQVEKWTEKNSIDQRQLEYKLQEK